jgi:hypothetical protein
LCSALLIHRRAGEMGQGCVRSSSIPGLEFGRKERTAATIGARSEPIGIRVVTEAGLDEKVVRLAYIAALAPDTSESVVAIGLASKTSHLPAEIRPARTARRRDGTVIAATEAMPVSTFAWPRFERP